MPVLGIWETDCLLITGEDLLIKNLHHLISTLGPISQGGESGEGVRNQETQ